jgi:hypothetical protein
MDGLRVMSKKTIYADAVWTGEVVRLVDPEKYRADLKRAGWRPGRPVQIRVTLPTRSEKANAYYWGVVLERIVEESESGNSAEELHDAFCERFITTERKRIEFFNRMTGETLTTDVDTRRSSALTGGPFYDFVEEVRKFALEFWGITTPAPDPEYWRKAA